MRLEILCSALLSALILSAAASAPAWANLAPSAEAAQPLAVGARAPDFTAHRVDNSSYTFSSEDLSHPVVLIFYRGGWCPYCNGQLADMHTVEPKLREAGYEVFFVSTDRPELLYSSLKDPSRVLNIDDAPFVPFNLASSQPHSHQLGSGRNTPVQSIFGAFVRNTHNQNGFSSDSYGIHKKFSRRKLITISSAIIKDRTTPNRAHGHMGRRGLDVFGNCRR